VLGKAGVGIYVDASPGAVVKQLRIRTSTPGFTASVYVASSSVPAILPSPGWKLVATIPRATARQTVPLDTAGQRSSYVLLWITQLPPGGDRVEISELAIDR
jgi:hypothetical protein